MNTKPRIIITGATGCLGINLTQYLINQGHPILALGRDKQKGQKLIAMGAIVSSEGHVLTKASSCVGARLATLSNGDSYKLKIKKRNEELDLALYQMISDRDDFSFIKWNESNASYAVSWVLSAFTELRTKATKNIREFLINGKLINCLNVNKDL